MNRETLATPAAQDDVARAQLAYDIAENQFNWATDARQIDAACYTLCATEVRLDSALRRRRSLFCPSGLGRSAN